MRYWLVSIILIGTATGAGAYLLYPVHVPTNCAPRGSILSVESDPKSKIDFINAGTRPVRLVSITTGGIEALFDTIPPKKKVSYDSSPRHFWMIRDGNGDCLGLFAGDSGHAIVTPTD